MAQAGQLFGAGGGAGGGGFAVPAGGAAAPPAAPAAAAGGGGTAGAALNAGTLTGPGGYDAGTLEVWLTALDIQAGDSTSGKFRQSNVRWQPDEEAVHCPLTRQEFNDVNRKHHCRMCGGVFGSTACDKRALVPIEMVCRHPNPKLGVENLHDPQRMCHPCFDALAPLQEELQQSFSNAVLENKIDTRSNARWFNTPLSSSLTEDVKKAAYTLRNFMFSGGILSDKQVPLELLRIARGLAFITVIKAGFLFTAKIGTGLVVARLPDGSWSAPSAIGTAGMGFGAQVGGEVTDYVILLNTQEAVESFTGGGQVVLGASLSLAVGPVGREAASQMHASGKGLAPAYSYSHSKGAFVGVSLEGSVITSRTSTNRNFYGKDVAPLDLLSGAAPRPPAAAPLYEALEDALASTDDMLAGGAGGR
jgi:SH3 domain-containing YSC84-like protein 1